MYKECRNFIKILKSINENIVDIQYDNLNYKDKSKEIIELLDKNIETLSNNPCVPYLETKKTNNFFLFHQTVLQNHKTQIVEDNISFIEAYSILSSISRLNHYISNI